MKAMDFARACIEGSGGMNDYEYYEFVVWDVPDRVAAAHWILKCLANPACEGSEEALAAIMAHRETVSHGPGLLGPWAGGFTLSPQPESGGASSPTARSKC